MFVTDLQRNTMSYDPNWIMKEKAKRWKQQERQLSHIEDVNAPRFHYSTMLCGKGCGAKGSPSIMVVAYPSVTCLPTCRICREKYLTSIGVVFDESGYPKTN
jgi:hypothetical protein